MATSIALRISAAAALANAKPVQKQGCFPTCKSFLGSSYSQRLVKRPSARGQRRNGVVVAQVKTGGGMFDNEEPSIVGDKQPKELPMFEVDPDSPEGYLKFPPGYLLELSTLPIYEREDVRRCCCFVAGGVYEQLLFYPVIEQLRKKYPGVAIDIIATQRAKQAYEMNPNVRRTFPYEWEDVQIPPAEFADILGKVKDGYYEMLVSTRQAGLGHAVFLWMCGTRQRMAYTIPDVNGAGAEKFLTIPLKAATTNQAAKGAYMYKEMLEALGYKGPQAAGVKIAISQALREVAGYKQGKAGIQKGEYILVHGLESATPGGSQSAASMLSRGDKDAVLPLEKLVEATKGAKLPVLYVVPQEKDIQRVKKAVGSDAHVLNITTPGQLAALIEDSAGVICTNTAALLLAMALNRPSVALLGSAEKASAFAPAAKEKQCEVVVSQTGSLSGLDLGAVSKAVVQLIGKSSKAAKEPALVAA